MKLGPVRRDEKLSSLAVDLTLSIVGLAALKAKSGVAPDARERRAAEELRDFCRRSLQMMRGNTARLIDAVPEEAIRRGLEETLTSLAPVSTNSLIRDAALLQRLVELLDALLSDRGIDARKAGLLLDTLHDVECSLEERSTPPDLTALVAIGRRDVG
jgi:hypothetical protein